MGRSIFGFGYSVPAIGSREIMMVRRGAIVTSNKALQQTLDPASRLAVAKRQSAPSTAELWR